MGESREVFIEEVCARSNRIAVVFILASVFLVVQVPYLFIADPDSAIYVISTLNVVGAGGFALVSGAALYYCRQRQDSE